MKDIIGIDSVKFYTLEDHKAHIKRILPLIRFQGSTTRYFYRHHNDVKIVFSFTNGMTTTSFSVPKLLYGNNFKLAGRKELCQAVTLVSNLIQLDLKYFKISRLDTTSDFTTRFKAVQHRNLLAKPARFMGMSKEFEAGYLYHINEEIRRSTRVVSVYQKQDKVRFEVKLLSCRKSKTTASGLIKHFYKHEPEVAELLKETFYNACVKHYVKTVGSTLRGKKLSGAEAEIRDQLYASLYNNYYNSFNQSYW